MYTGGEGALGLRLLKYKLIYIFSQRNSGNRTSEDAMTFFFGLHLILDVGKREDAFFCSSGRKHLVETETGNWGPPFQISGHDLALNKTEITNLQSTTNDRK